MTLDPTIKGEKLDHEWGFFVFRGEVLESEITTTLFTLYRNILREKTLTKTPSSTLRFNLSFFIHNYTVVCGTCVTTQQPTKLIQLVCQTIFWHDSDYIQHKSLLFTLSLEIQYRETLSYNPMHIS